MFHRWYYVTFRATNISIITITLYVPPPSASCCLLWDEHCSIVGIMLPSVQQTYQCCYNLPCYILIYIYILSFDFVLTCVSLFQGVSAGPLPPQVPADSVPLDLSSRAAPAAVPPPGPLHAPPVCLPQVGPC